MSLLVIDNLCAAYDGSEVLHHISFDVVQGDFVAVIGANTAGKSTLLRAISGLVPRTSGRIALEGENLLALPAHQIPFRGISHVPEGRHVFPAMSVEDNLWLGGYHRRHDKADLQRTLEAVFMQFPRLAERRRQLAGTLSGGEQQRDQGVPGKGQLADHFAAAQAQQLRQAAAQEIARTRGIAVEPHQCSPVKYLRDLHAKHGGAHD